MKRLAEKVAIITGAGNGQGAFEAELFAREGAAVVVSDIDYDNAAKVAETINQKHGKAIAIRHDIASEADWKKVVEKAIECFGKIDILVNNAGIHSEKLMSEIKFDEWNKMIAVNLTGTFMEYSPLFHT